MKRRISVMALVLAIPLALTLFSGGAASQSRGGTATFGISQEPETLDPHVTGQAVTTRMMVNVLDTLVWMDNKGKYHPHLAASWRVNENATEYVFRLRQGVKFHDGTPFNAEAVKFSFNRIADPTTKSQSAVSSLGPYDRTEVVDQHTVRVTFKKPYAIFLTMVAGATLAPVSPEAVRRLGADFGKRPVGTGPFKVAEWVRGDRLRLVRNDDYNWPVREWGHRGRAYLDQIIFRFIPEGEVRAGAVETAEITGAEAIAPRYIARMRRNPTLQVLTAPFPGSPRQFMINTRRAPTDDVRVRQAILYGVDRKAIVDTLYAGAFPVAYGPLSSNLMGYLPAVEKAYRYDRAKAQALLNEAGWTPGPGGIRQKGGQELRVGIYTIAGLGAHEEIAQLVQAQLRELGFRADIVAQARPAWYSSLGRGQHHLAPMALWSTDPDALRRLYHSKEIGDGFNWSHYVNAEVDALLMQATETPDPRRRTSLYHKAQEIIYLRDAAVLPVHEQVNVVAISSKVKGVFFDLNGYPLFYDAYFEGR